MCNARCRADWNRTACVLATMVNIFRDPKKTKPVSPSDFNPYAEQERERQVVKAPITVLRDVFCREQKKE